MSSKYFLISFLLLNNLISYSQWVPQNSGTSNFLAQIFFPSDDTGYVVQGNGVFRKTVNGGANWNLVSGIPNIFQMYFTSNDTGFAIGSNTILKTNNGGSIWNVQYTDSNILMASVYFFNANIGYVAGVSSNFDTLFIFKTINGGNNWSAQNSFNTFFAPPMNIFFVSPDTGFFCGGVSNICMTTDGGLSLDTVYIDSLNFLHGIHFPSRDTGYAVGDFGLIVKTIDGGFNWNVMPNSGNSNPLYSVFFTSNDTGYAVGGNGISSGTILKTTNGGNSWTNEPGLVQTFNSVYFPSSNIGYTCGTGGAILKYDAPVGVVENGHQESITTYPNPTSGIFTLQSTNQQPGNSTITIFNSLGDIIIKSEILNSKSKIDLSSQPGGIYFVKVTEGEKVMMKKIVKM